MEKAGLLGTPPPYEAPSHRRGSRRFIRGPLSVRTALTFILTSAVIWLCLTISRATSPKNGPASSMLATRFDEAVEQCRAAYTPVHQPGRDERTSNPRWSPSTGQQDRVVLQNARLFHGTDFYPGLVDVYFGEGIIKNIVHASNEPPPDGVVSHNVHGRYVTPGLVDMHSHHMAYAWPAASMNADDTETHESTGAVTPQMRILDGLKPYDFGTTLICSGGVTSSLIIPGSSNIVGGEGVAVKNVLYSGAHGEPVVEEVLLERGIEADKRRRYMKMAFGENPKRVWGHSRLGTAWHLRQHMQKAKDLKEKQDEYCAVVDKQTKKLSDVQKTAFVKENGKFPFDLALESSVALLRGKVGLHNHNYEPEDLQAMLRISKEFGYKVKAFHHATSAWQIPELLKQEAENITIAIFAEFSLYKSEAYNPSLSAGHILDSHGINVAYKSDHSTRELNAKYLASQAAVAHSFNLPELKALQAITSIPANAMDQGHRIGYCRPGYDADIVVWDAHPLAVGATPLQVFVDGVAQLDDDKVKESTGFKYTDKVKATTKSESAPAVRLQVDEKSKRSCANSGKSNLIVTGIKKNFATGHTTLKATAEQDMQLVIEGGKIVCFGGDKECTTARVTVQKNEHSVITLENGHLSRGLTAVTSSLGMHDIGTDSDFGDGDASSQKLGDPDTVVYAKHGVHLDGKEFARARLGGVTRAVTGLVAEAGDVQGVSTEILTSGKKSLLHGGIVKDDVAFRVTLGAKSLEAEGSVSRGVQMLRRILQDGKGKHNETVYGKVSKGEMPLVVTCQNRYDIEQLVLIKKDFPTTNLIILGGQEASYVAQDLAEANIPVLLSEGRTAPDTFRGKDALPGPPLSRSPASFLHEAGVKLGLSLAVNFMPADFRLNSLGPEAGWIGKYAGMNETEQMDLVTTNIEQILGLKPSQDLVLFEGSPLQYGATVVMALHGDEKGQLEIATCYPEEN